MRSPGLASCLALVVVVAACSGAKDTDLLAPVGSEARTEPSSAESGTGTGTGTGSGTGTGTGTGDAGGVDAGPPPTTMPCGQANGNALTCTVGAYPSGGR